MDCSRCEDKRCMALQACPASKTDQEALRADYQDSDRQPLVQAAARLVDGGRAGSLNRVEETIEYARDLGLEKLGLAYCYAFDAEADLLRRIFKREGFSLCCVRCTASGLAQQEINSESPLPSVSCNPLAQARQLDAEGVQLVIVMGLCLGHDILFQRELKTDSTTLLVKDRSNGHRPLDAIRAMADALEG